MTEKPFSFAARRAVVTVAARAGERARRGAKLALVEVYDSALRMAPERAAEIIAEVTSRRRPPIVVGSAPHVINIAQRLLPVSHARLLRRLLA